MFDYSFVPSGKARPLPIALACLSEALLLAAMVVVPMLFVETLPQRALLSAVRLALVPTAPPSPPPPMAAPKIHRTAPAPRKFNPDALVSAVVVPKEVAVINDAPPAEMDVIVAGGVPGGIPGLPGIAGGMGFSALGAAPPPPPPPPPLKVLAPAAPPPPVTPRQVSVGGDVQAALIVQRVEPIYPFVAQQGRIGGNVVLSAVIDADGNIKKSGGRQRPSVAGASGSEGRAAVALPAHDFKWRSCRGAHGDRSAFQAHFIGGPFDSFPMRRVSEVRHGFRPCATGD